MRVWLRPILYPTYEEIFNNRIKANVLCKSTKLFKSTRTLFQCHYFSLKGFILCHVSVTGRRRRGVNGESVAYFVNECIIEGRSHHIEIKMDYLIIALVESGIEQNTLQFIFTYSIEKQIASRVVNQHAAYVNYTGCTKERCTAEGV